MMKINQGTKTHKLFTAMKNGEKFTPAQAEKRFGIKNLSAEASRIRQSGYAVYARSRKAGNNTQVTEYVMDRPTRKIVALGYMAKRLGLSI